MDVFGRAGSYKATLFNSLTLSMLTAHRHMVWLLEVASYSDTVCLSSEPLGVALVSVFQGFSFR